MKYCVGCIVIVRVLDIQLFHSARGGFGGCSLLSGLGGGGEPIQKEAVGESQNKNTLRVAVLHCSTQSTYTHILGSSQLARGEELTVAQSKISNFNF